jgi:LacI family transcriptional regulator
MITAKEIAKICKVSSMTVSRALNNRGRVSPTTKKKILQVAEKYNYRPSAIVNALRTGRTRLFGFIFEVSSNYFSWEVFAGMQDELYPKGYDFLALQWCPKVINQERFFASILDRRVEGVIVFPSSKVHNYGYLQSIQQHGIPIVAVDRKIPNLNTNFVGTDNFTGATKAISYLISKGHNNIVFAVMKDQKKVSSNIERLQGYKEAMRSHNLKPLPVCEFTYKYEDMTQKFSEITQWLKKSIRPSAIFASHDYLANDIINVALANDIKLPEELSIVGFGEIPICTYSPVQLTTIRQHPREIGFESAKLLIDLVEKAQKNQQLDTQSIKHPCELIVKESVAVISKNS